MESPILLRSEVLNAEAGYPQDEGMSRHILEAMVINVKRGVHYARITKGRSLLLSFIMVFSELMVLAPAWLFDRWGKKYNRLGIRVIAADFISMSKAQTIDAPLRFTGSTPSGEIKDLSYQMSTYAKSATTFAREHDFRLVAAHTHHILTQVEALEVYHQALLPMARHILESIGFAAANAVKYEDQSQKRTNRLCSWMIQFQISGIALALPIDRMAQSCHILGAGIIENDVPPIPFHETYRAMQ